MERQSYISDSAWQLPSQYPSLGTDDCALWRVFIPAELSKAGLYRSILDSEEIQRSEKFHREYKQSVFITSRAILKLLLGHYTEIVASRIELQYDMNGKPRLPSIQFNLSHSGNYALLAFSRNKTVGVDIQEHKRKMEWTRIANKYFPAKDKMAIYASRNREQSTFFDIWSRKEAYAKALGESIFHHLHTVVHTRDVHKLQDDNSGKEWTIKSLDTAKGYSSAICFENNYGELETYTWNNSLFCL